MCNVSCVHIETYKSRSNFLHTYEILHSYYVSCISKCSWKRKARDCLCMTESCRTKYQRVHMCLSCIYFGCFNGKHIHEHAKRSNHLLAFDTNYGHIFCFECGDYQYDADIEKISQKQLLVASQRRGTVVNYKSEPNAEEPNVLHEHRVINVADIGLRGIVNLGYTCYMSVILQSLVHAPVFRDYFLSFKHKCKYQKSKSPNGVPESIPECFACEMSDIVQEFFSGKQTAFIPDRFLHLLWIHEKSLRGAGPQDAHHCLLALLDNLHLNCKDADDDYYIESRNNASSDDYSCKCIIDKIFTGHLDYEYLCPICKNVSIQNAAFKDISLALQSDSLLANNGPRVDALSLDDCLRKAMQDEIHGYKCNKCLQESKISSVQMTLKKLPLITVFYLNQGNKEHKIYMSFPEYLDMSDYMLTPLVQNNNIEAKPTVSGPHEKSSYKFYLFAVVVHEGAGCGGHYKCYVRRHKQSWFLCNDSNVDPISVETILEQKAYLLFYHRQFLEYEVTNAENTNFA